jgi:hypothetical protein
MNYLEILNNQIEKLSKMEVATVDEAVKIAQQISALTYEIRQMNQ